MCYFLLMFLIFIIPSAAVTRQTAVELIQHLNISLRQGGYVFVC